MPGARSLSEIEFLERRINNLRTLHGLYVIDSWSKTASFRQTPRSDWDSAHNPNMVSGVKTQECLNAVTVNRAVGSKESEFRRNSGAKWRSEDFYASKVHVNHDRFRHTMLHMHR